MLRPDDTQVALREMTHHEFIETLEYLGFSEYSQALALNYIESLGR